MWEIQNDQHLRRSGLRLWPFPGLKKRPRIHSISSGQTVQTDSFEETTTSPTTIDGPLDTTVTVDTESPQDP